MTDSLEYFPCICYWQLPSFPSLLSSFLLFIFPSFLLPFLLSFFPVLPFTFPSFLPFLLFSFFPSFHLPSCVHISHPFFPRFLFLMIFPSIVQGTQGWSLMKLRQLCGPEDSVLQWSNAFSIWYYHTQHLKTQQCVGKYFIISKI